MFRSGWIAIGSSVGPGRRQHAAASSPSHNGYPAGGQYVPYVARRTAGCPERYRRDRIIPTGLCSAGLTLEVSSGAFEVLDQFVLPLGGQAAEREVKHVPGLGV